MNPNNDEQLHTDKKKENLSPEPPLSEKDFIQNGWSLASFPFWLWLFLLGALVLVSWGTKNWYDRFLNKEKINEPFLEVTNREFSVFLWQFPSFLRSNVSQKTGYLSGFFSTYENFSPETAENFVEAPPELIFLYHTWDRLLSDDFIARPIPSSEFAEFLKQMSEWEPQNWKTAPQGYVDWVTTWTKSKKNEEENLQDLPESQLPMIVRQVFQGWKNYFKEGKQINEMQPTFAEVKAFLEKHPHYARNYWRNIDEIHHQIVAGPQYLSGMLDEKAMISDAKIPNEQLAPFLKVALFNAEQALQNR